MFTNMHTELHSSVACQVLPRDVGYMLLRQGEAVGVGEHRTMGKSVVEEKQLTQDSKVRASGSVGVGKGMGGQTTVRIGVFRRGTIDKTSLVPQPPSLPRLSPQSWWLYPKLVADGKGHGEVLTTQLPLLVLEVLIRTAWYLQTGHGGSDIVPVTQHSGWRKEKVK